jgi:hypothetical protein
VLLDSHSDSYKRVKQAYRCCTFAGCEYTGSFKMAEFIVNSIEFLPSKQAVAGSSPVSRSHLYIVSLQAGHKPPGGNQAALW